MDYIAIVTSLSAMGYGAIERIKQPNLNQEAKHSLRQRGSIRILLQAEDNALLQSELVLPICYYAHGVLNERSSSLNDRRKLLQFESKRIILGPKQIYLFIGYAVDLALGASSA